MRGEVEIGASRGIMVLLVKQVHLQKEVGAVDERCISTSSQVGKEGVGGECTGCRRESEEGGEGEGDEDGSGEHGACLLAW